MQGVIILSQMINSCFSCILYFAFLFLFIFIIYLECHCFNSACSFFVFFCFASTQRLARQLHQECTQVAWRGCVGCLLRVKGTFSGRSRKCVEVRSENLNLKYVLKFKVANSRSRSESPVSRALSGCLGQFGSHPTAASAR